MKNKKIIQYGGGLGDGQPKPTGFMVCNAENQVIKKVDNLNYYNRQINLLQKEKEFVESLINTLSYTHKQYIIKRYCDGLSIKQVADFAQETENRGVVDEENMKKTIQSITDKLENKYNELQSQSTL